MADISLTASMRSNLLSLQKTQSLMDVTQERLSTGKKVNSAIDNPSSYYTAQSLTNRANDLGALMDSMGQGIQTIKAADEAIKAITSFSQQAKAIANTARDESVKTDAIKASGAFTATGANTTFSVDYNGKSVDVTLVAATTDVAGFVTALNTAFGVAGINAVASGTTMDDLAVDLNAAGKAAGDTLVMKSSTGASFNGEIGSTARLAAETRYNDILGQIDQLAKDSGYKGVNLLQENDLTVIFNEDRSSNIVIKGVDGSSTGLGLGTAAGWANANNNAIDNAVKAVDGAISQLRTMASEFGNNYSVVQNREDFTENLINVLTEGADKLTLADMNEESANMLALQTRQQLAINSLSLASQAAQSVLKLF